MQEVFEKILEKMEKLKKCGTKHYEDGKYIYTSPDYDHGTLNKTIEIVKQEAAEYNNGWIPCDVEMPKEHDSIFTEYKGTEKWNDNMFEKTSDTVNVTVVNGYGNRRTTHAYTTDGKWSCDLLRLNKSYRIIAWQPLPQPYQPKGE